MDLIRRVRKLIVDFIAPKSTALVPVYVSTGVFSRTRDGYLYKCGICQSECEYGAREASVTEMRTCTGCGNKYNLLRSLGGRSLETLPTRALVAPASQPRFIAVGESKGGEVTWTGAPPSPGVQWR